METTNSFNDGVKTVEKIFSDSTKQITDFYTKQLNTATGFYKNLFDSFSAGNKEWNTNAFSNGFLNNGLTKMFEVPLNGIGTNFTNPFLTIFDKMYKQMADYNSAMLSNLTNGMKSNVDLSEISKTYQDMVNDRIEASKNILKTATDAYNKQLDFSIENNKKAIEEMRNQFNVMIRQNQKFRSDIMSSSQAPIKNAEKTFKDSISPEIKKRSSVTANELSDHKL